MSCAEQIQEPTKHIADYMAETSQRNLKVHSIVNPKTIIMRVYKDMQEELKELIRLVKLEEKYSVLVSDGLLPLDLESIKFHDDSVLRIAELSQKYGLI